MSQLARDYEEECIVCDRVATMYSVMRYNKGLINLAFCRSCGKDKELVESEIDYQKEVIDRQKE